MLKLLDLSKAFDTVDSKILMKKLLKYDLRGSFGELLKSYLNNRTQYVLPMFPNELGLNSRRQQRKNLFWLVVE